MVSSDHGDPQVSRSDGVVAHSTISEPGVRAVSHEGVNNSQLDVQMHPSKSYLNSLAVSHVRLPELSRAGGVVAHDAVPESGGGLDVSHVFGNISQLHEQFTFTYGLSCAAA